MEDGRDSVFDATTISKSHATADSVVFRHRHTLIAAPAAGDQQRFARTAAAGRCTSFF
jgi:hypothetical protein